MRRGPVRRRARAAAVIAICAVSAAAFLRQETPRETPGLQPDGSVVITTSQRLTPAGTLRLLQGARPKDMAVSPDGDSIAVLSTSRVSIFGIDGALRAEVSLQAGALGIAWTPDGRSLYASLGNGKLARLTESGGRWSLAEQLPVESGGSGNPQPNGIAISKDGARLFVALGIRNAVAVLALPSHAIQASVPVGVAPYAIALSPDGRTLVTANRGGRRVSPGPLTAASAGTHLRVDRRTDAALRGSLTFIDTETLRAREIDAGRQPFGMAFSADSQTLYAANSDEDTVSVVDVARTRVRSTIRLRPDLDSRFGQIPTDCALSPDGKTLYAACGGANAVGVIPLDGRPRVTGWIPAGWYPVALAHTRAGLVVASSKGIGARPERGSGAGGRGMNVHASTGTVQFLTAADMDLVRHTAQVAQNNRWERELPPRPGVTPVPIPERVGEPSLFKHVVYIIKENHTYDLDLGDMPEGNGDRSLCLFGEEVTPNGHALARQFVLLDNTYTSGTNSADGHQWVASSIANGYIEQNYNAHARSYPYDGGDPLAYAPSGFLWTAVRDRRLSQRIYGEFVNRPSIVDTRSGARPTWKLLWEDYKSGGNRFRITAETDNASLRPFLHPRFIGFPSTVSDQWRADQFLADLDEFERTGSMPSFVMMLLPNDHTSGTRAGMPTPRASVADNDLALGRIVDRLTKSRFWKEMLILVIQDDSQLGLDHVDGHRTVAYVVSPYTRRGAVVSLPYNHTSFARTIELTLGVPAMNRFDGSATSLAACFTQTPDLTPFNHLPNRIPLDEMNPEPASLRGEARRLAEACERLDWSDIDRAHAETVSRAVWASVHPARRFPAAQFHPPDG